jgi:hypothetical protein
MVKSYIVVRCSDVNDLDEARLRAAALLASLKEDAQRW